LTLGSTLLAFDFDGTLAPICGEPAKVEMNRGAAELLREAAQMQGIAVAIASGRDVEDLLTYVNVPGAYLIGSHGLEVRAPGGVVVWDSAALSVDLEPPLRERIASHGLRLERKKHAVALHWRGVDVQSITAIIDDFRAWGRQAELDVIEGRCVVEARCRGGSKEEALRWLASAIGAQRVIYAGDDLTDFGALRFAARRGRAVFVANGEQLAPPSVTVVSSFRELFRLVREEVLI
jgi:alpha,alpha-trehalase